MINILGDLILNIVSIFLMLYSSILIGSKFGIIIGILFFISNFMLDTEIFKQFLPANCSNWNEKDLDIAGEKSLIPIVICNMIIYSIVKIFFI